MNSALSRFWEENTLERNALRWRDSDLAICTDLLWEELDGAERTKAVAAFLDDDEAADDGRLADTDEFASITRSLVIDGIVACHGKGLDAKLKTRGCKLLERGLRNFFGVQWVKAVRPSGFWSQSGGSLPDGNGYGIGTIRYWLSTLRALHRVGASPPGSESWVWNSALALHVHPLTPSRGGFASYGDLDSYDNFSKEPGSLPLFQHNVGSLALQSSLLSDYGAARRAELLRRRLFEDYLRAKDGASLANLEAVPSSWPMLLMPAHSTPSLRRPPTENMSIYSRLVEVSIVADSVTGTSPPPEIMTCSST